MADVNISQAPLLIEIDGRVVQISQAPALIEIGPVPTYITQNLCLIEIDTVKIHITQMLFLLELEYTPLFFDVTRPPKKGPSQIIDGAQPCNSALVES